MQFNNIVLRIIKKGIFMKILNFTYWKYVDYKRIREKKKQGIIDFKPFGLWMFCGRQGSGKTVGIVYHLEEMRKKYPKAIIVTNFDYKYADFNLKSLNDLLTIKNGEDGVIFAIDELQNEFSSAVSKNFPETVLSLVTQQRKQRICILASSQVYMRVAKPLREQCFYVVDCRTFFQRWTRMKCFDAQDYNTIVDKSDVVEAKMKLRKIWKKSFIQTDFLRNLYDTYAVVLRLQRGGF